MFTPPEKDEVAVPSEMSLPPESVSPWDDASPPPATEMPDAANVEVAVSFSYARDEVETHPGSPPVVMESTLPLVPAASLARVPEVSELYSVSPAAVSVV